MWYLFFQMWLWILIAFVLGWVANWYLCCRRVNEESSGATAYVTEPEAVSELAPVPVAGVSNVVSDVSEDITEKSEDTPDDSWKPVGFSSAPQDADDLKRIKGIGKVNEKALNGIGIYTFSQIAEWSADNISWVEGFLAFPGRIGREDWVSQAKTLAGGGTTNFAKKVDSGDVDYD